MQVFGLNSLDLFLLVILFVGILLGFVQGALSQLISAASIWLGLVVTLWLYNPLSDNIFKKQQSGFSGLGMSETAADTLSFLILLIVFFNGFRLLVKYLSAPPEEKKKKKKKRGKVGPIEEPIRTPTQRFIFGPLNALGGMGMGFVMTTIWTALILGVLQFIFQPTGADVPYSGFSRGLISNMHSSLLLPFFNMVLGVIVQSVDLFVPRNADILKAFLRFIA